MEKILIVRFSSFGDVLQCLSVAGALKRQFPASEIHWVTRQEFGPLIQGHPAVARIWTLPRQSSLQDLLRLVAELRLQNYTHVYDAHNSLRSRIIGWALLGFGQWRRWRGSVKFLRRSIFRVRRFLLFRFRWNLFPQPFSGQRDLLAPMARWGLPVAAPPVPQLFLPQEAVAKVGREIRQVVKGSFIALAPSAAFRLKRWPVGHWRRLIELAKESTFVVLGGPEDHFLQELKDAAPERVFVFAGRWSLAESSAAVSWADALVTNDTGLLHVAEQLGKPCLALMGPAPFGFPSRPATVILERKLKCRPCSKHGQGPCRNREFQKCLVDITPQEVYGHLRRLPRSIASDRDLQP